MKTVGVVIVLAVMAFALAGCASGPNNALNTPGPSGGVAGFGWGLWHGVISPVTFIVSLFNKSVGIYDAHNNGGWYNLGFLMGAAIVFGGGGGGAARRRR